MLNALEKFEERYGINIEYSKNGMPSDIFDTFLTRVAGKINMKSCTETNNSADSKIYVMIDEYDHFANELLSYQTDIFEETVSRTGFVRKWYEVLKSGTDNGLVQRIYGTGVSPVTLASLTSGFNISKSLTRNVRFNECLGFTEEEVKLILRDTLSNSINIEEEMPVLKQHYNGYLFSDDAVNRVFNSDMILYFASEYKVNPKYYAVFEIKYIKKEDYSEKNLQTKIEDARKQIYKYNLSKELRELSNLKKWILVFCKDKLIFKESII